MITVVMSLSHSSAEFEEHRRKQEWNKKGRIVAAVSSALGGTSLSLSAMSRNSENPVQTPMAVSASDRALSSEYPTKSRSEARPGGWKRLFVQTDTGCVHAIQLDRGANAHTVKRKLQVALNFPIEDSSLTCGDLVLKSDLSTIRNDSPLLLIKTLMHRSSSAPCLSATFKDIQQQKDTGCPVEVLVCPSCCSRTRELVKDVARAIRNCVDPVPVNGGLGGAYYFRNSKGENAAIVKPNDEEPYAPNNPKGIVGSVLGQPGFKGSVRVGETGFREVAAYLLDYDNSAKVPPTVLVKICHPVFHVNGVNCGLNNAAEGGTQAVSKIASFQQFVPHDFDASDYGTSSFPVSAVHRIGILDIRIFNTDRHAGNLLVRKQTGTGQFSNQTELFPIDHGLCLPECLEDPYFEWIHWPQASIPFSEDELEYIAKLDPTRDSEMLRMELPMIREACLRVLILSTIFLKEATTFGLCLAEIGEMMTREFTGKADQPSELEFLCMEARRLATEHDSGSEDLTQFELDGEDHEMTEEPLSKSAVPKSVVSVKTSESNRNQSVIFVNLADMGLETWGLFLEKFQELLPEAFRSRK